MTVDEIIDRLYGLPLAEFTAARNEAARELRKAGEREAAERVKALRKPTAAAGAVNRLVREQRSEVEQFLRTAAELRDVQLSGRGDLGAAKRREHEKLERLTGIGGEAVRQTLLAAAVDDDAAQRLLEARLEHELEPRGFGTLLEHAPPAALRPAGATAPKRRRLSPSGRRQSQTTARPAPESRRPRRRSARPKRRSATPDSAGAWPRANSRKRGRRSRQPVATSNDSIAASPRFLRERAEGGLGRPSTRSLKWSPVRRRDGSRTCGFLHRSPRSRSAAPPRRRASSSL